MEQSPVVQVLAIQTSVPDVPVAAGRLPVRIAGEPLRHDLAQCRSRLLLYYRDSTAAHDMAWTVAAWMKESLSAALPASPEFAGRLRRTVVGDATTWELKLTDSGIRMIQASTDNTMAEFLSAADGGAEAALAYWEDIDVERPEYSPLMFVQVTRFAGGDGYSIGISCSLLLADPVRLIGFLKSWAAVHAQMLAGRRLCSNSLFHLRYYHQLPSAARPHRLTSNASAVGAGSSTLLFKVSDGGAAASVAAAVGKKLGTSPAKITSACVISHDGGLRIECSAGQESVLVASSQQQLEEAQWKEFGLEEVAVTSEGNRPVRVSYSIVSCIGDQGLLVVMRRSAAEGAAAGDVFVAATLPC